MSDEMVPLDLGWLEEELRVLSDELKALALAHPTAQTASLSLFAMRLYLHVHMARESLPQDQSVSSLRVHH